MKNCRVFIGCIPGESKQQEILEVLNKFAQVISVKLSVGRNSQNQEYCLGYGFAVCESKGEMEKLLENSNAIRYRGRCISLKEYKAGSKLKEEKKDFNRRRLFIGTVPKVCLASELKELFLKFGEIENIYFVDQSCEQDHKYGYIIFKNQVSAQAALASTQN